MYDWLLPRPLALFMFTVKLFTSVEAARLFITISEFFTESDI